MVAGPPTRVEALGGVWTLLGRGGGQGGRRGCAGAGVSKAAKAGGWHRIRAGEPLGLMQQEDSVGPQWAGAAGEGTLPSARVLLTGTWNR